MVTPWDKLSRKEKRSFAKTSNGCGTGIFLVNDLFYKWDCYAHDYNYQEGGSFRDRLVSDLYFLLGMCRRAVRKNHSYSFLVLALARAFIYYFLVRLFGWLVWNKKH